MVANENVPQDRIDIFFHIFMYELEIMLRQHQEEMQGISFQLGEANTDRPLKVYLKSFIMNNLTAIPPQKADNTLTIKVIDEAMQCQTRSFKYEDFTNVTITSVLLEEELDDIQKRFIAESKSSGYTKPDLFFIIEDGCENTHYRLIELKSTKDNTIHGSSIQQINPFEWVLFVKRENNDISVVTGQYINSINPRLQFPDRSPRPQVAFNELVEWNNTNRICRQGNLEYIVNHTESATKHQLLADWQDYLADRWIKVLKAQTTKANEPWFSNAMRKFAVKFIDFYESLDQSGKLRLKENIQRLIE